MSSDNNINYGVSEGSLIGSSIAKNKELTMITEMDIVSNKGCIITI
jgi:hypothetical protein